MTSSLEGADDHSFTGTGRIQVARRDYDLLVRIDGLTTNTRRLKPLVATFFRKDYRRLRPSFGPFLCHIQIEHIGPTRGHDVDNVAKALLDALNGIVWYDDSQVHRLIVEKFESDRSRLHMRVRPLKKCDLSPRAFGET